MKTNFNDSFETELKMLNHLDLFDNSTNYQTPLISEQNDEEENNLFLLDSEESENEEQPMDINEEQTTLNHQNRILTSSNTISISPMKRLVIFWLELKYSVQKIGKDCLNTSNMYFIKVEILALYTRNIIKCQIEKPLKKSLKTESRKFITKTKI